jgi:hypothetical protein
MNDSPRPTPWLGFAFDATIIASMTALAALRIVPIMVFVALIGPLIGSRLALRYLRDGGGGPPDGGAGGSAVVSLVLALATVFRRPIGL